MLTFRSISYKNFLSAGDVPITVNLDQNITTLIVGTNGSGKSTILDAICFALFGKPHRDIKNPQLINSINGKNCEVHIKFSIGLDKFEVIRGYKPSIFEIWKNGTLLNQESHSRDYQGFLETNILKMNKKSFNQIVVLGAGNFVPFMAMPIWDRRGVIEDLLDISVFSDMNHLIKDKLAKSRDSIEKSENQLAIFKEKVTLQSKHLSELRQIDADYIQRARDEITSLENEISEAAKIAQVHRNFLDDNSNILIDAHAKLQNTHQTMVGYRKQIQSNLSKIGTELEFYEKNDECPTCQQQIEAPIKERRAHACSLKSAEFNDGLVKLNKSIDDVDLKFKNAVVQMNDLAKNQTSLAAVNGTIASLQSQIGALHRKISESSDKVDIKQTEDALSTSERDYLALTETRLSQIDDRAYIDVIQEMLRDTGIKAKVIKQYVPLMNKFINQYLSVLDFFVSFTLDDSFNESIRSRHRDDFSYASFSEGEKMRINLAILFTWRQIAKLKNHCATNLLILDETFDSSLDGDGVENLLRILNTLTTTNVFVITHKPETMQDKFSAMIKFEKIGNFSHVHLT